MKLNEPTNQSTKRNKRMNKETNERANERTSDGCQVCEGKEYYQTLPSITSN